MTVAPAERGSVLMLVPAAVLVLFVLASITVDFSIAFLAQRELTAAAAAAANDVAGAALSDDAFYSGGSPGIVVLDQGRAEALAADALEARDIRGVHEIEPTTLVVGDRVCVTLTGRVDYIFARAVPGGPKGRTVAGRAVATAVRDGASPGVAAGDICGG